ncbi:DEAD/DEAH box helicase [uncultured Bacteroides sp.]|uniref:DEAD/DEAH box helicase n=1 Tax=uncultured Bacteroides sp. TaxID=162156 RepID=UPI002AAB2F2D|nr:DEAD/DEAH box helicase [uncultured Bacteroides sp.]
MTKQSTSTQIVIVLSQHPVLGALLIPYTAEKRENETIHLIEQAFHTSRGIALQINESERKAIEISSHYTEKYLMRAYSKEKRCSDFLRKLSGDTLKKIIRPYIEKKLLEMVELIAREKLPFYEKQTGSNLLYAHNSYLVTPYINEITFQFTVTQETFSYAMQCQRNGIVMSLRDKKPVVILTNSPACLLMGRELHLFRDIEASRIFPFTHKKTVCVDSAHTNKYIDKIVTPAIKNHKVISSGLNILEEQKEYESILTISENLSEKKTIELTFRYGEQYFSPNTRISKVVWTCDENEHKNILYFNRNIPYEQRAIALLENLGLKQINETQFTLHSDKENVSISNWIEKYKETINQNFKLINQKTGYKYCLEEVQMEHDYTNEHDWFDLHITIIIGQLRIPFTAFRKHILAGIREYILPDKRIIMLPEEWFSKYSNLLEIGESQGEKIRIRHPFIGVLESAIEINKKRKKKVTLPKKVLEPPLEFNAKLRPYQKEGFSWMVHMNELNFNGCLADDMGLGKTIQTLALLQHTYTFKSTSKSKREKAGDENEGKLPQEVSNKAIKKSASLIVVPTSLIHNWQREATRFTNLSVYEYPGVNHVKIASPARKFNQHQIILMSYGIMRNSIDVLNKYLFEYVILDESQNIKNSDSITSQTVIQLRSKHKLILTGTPIENSLKDLWSQFHFLQPELLGKEAEFNKRFITPIRQGDEAARALLKNLIEPFILRRSKHEVAPELPLLTEEVLYCDMTEDQDSIYNKEKNSLRNVLLDIKFQERSNLTILNGIMRLRQLACHPQMVFPDFTEESGKIKEIINTFETLQSEGHKVLIFSSFVKHLELIAKAFDERKWGYAMLIGSTNKREEEIQHFSSNEDINAFLISLKAGGVGLNLTQADYIFIIDPWWNPAAEMQAVSRAHRIGQTKRVIAYRFITKGSIEEKIIQLQEEKKKLAETFITNNNPLESLSDNEWEKLLE